MSAARLVSLPSLLAAALLVGIVSTEAAGSDERENDVPVIPVDHVDLDRYLGVWHEVAKIPNRYQAKCVRGTTAEYSRRSDGRIDVRNRCVEADGRQGEAKGIAKIMDAESNAKLKVSFVSFLGWRPFWGDYWILGLDPEYRWAIVGTPNRKYGWILGRTPTLDEETMETLFAILERNGYERAAFEVSAP
jgi:apolipoprotein D and lipocalin family protein